ncbi:MAG: hypothetical protein JXK92_01545 [Erysipelotrichaceae bacterium]|nr:hypothetical protein [Erysipelotrichaceae bacterium]
MDEERCLNCGSTHVMKVEYGMPDDAMVARIEAGEILHGGCKVNGLTQSLFCMDCETRFDPVSTPEFMSALQRIKFTRDGESFDIVLEHGDSGIERLVVTQECKTTIITNHRHIDQLIQCGLEFWNQAGFLEKDEAGEWRLEWVAEGYFRNDELVSGNRRAPYAFDRWLDFLAGLPVFER